MRPLFLLAASVLAASVASPALAQDHSAHGTPAPAPAEPEVDHAEMDHSHGLDTAVVGPDPDEQAMDHSQMDHGGMGRSMPAGPAEGSGTSRLPPAEGMMPGLHFDLGGGWIGMAHGYLWGVYTDQTGPRCDD